MNLPELRQKIENKRAGLAVIGLGYVGLPVACMFTEKGFDVVGIEIKRERVEKINAGISPIEGKEPGLAELLARVVAAGRLQATADYESLRDCDVILIDVETPVNDDHIPEYKALKAACGSLGPILKPGALVIVESTLAPGTMDGVVRPLLEETSGRRSGQGFFLGTCPERVMPGKLLANLRHVSRVCGGETAETAEMMIALYRHVVEVELDAADCITAELVKTAENAYRDVNIAFANEVALICEAVGGDVWKVRDLVNRSPGRDMLLPGAGVGGHCIPKDPWLLVYQAQEQGVDIRLIPAARAVNEGMPLHIMRMLESALCAAGKSLRGARIAVLGYAYLENSDDVRNSPSQVLVERLQAAGAEVVIHDPWVAEYNGDVLERLRGCDGLAMMVAHSEYQTLDLTAVRKTLRTPILIDGRRVHSGSKAESAGLVYRGLGQEARET